MHFQQSSADIQFSISLHVLFLILSFFFVEKPENRACGLFILKLYLFYFQVYKPENLKGLFLHLRLHQLFVAKRLTWQDVTCLVLLVMCVCVYGFRSGFSSLQLFAVPPPYKEQQQQPGIDELPPFRPASPGSCHFPSQPRRANMSRSRPGRSESRNKEATRFLSGFSSWGADGSRVEPQGGTLFGSPDCQWFCLSSSYDYCKTDWSSSEFQSWMW